VRGETAKRVSVIVGRLFQRRHLRLADVCTHHEVGGAIRETFGHGVGALVVEPQSVDEGLTFGQAKQARLGVSRLGVAGDGADLGEPEAELPPHVEAACVLIEPGSKAEPVRERNTKESGGCVDGAGAAHPTAHHGGHRPLVHGFGVAPKEERA